MNKVKRIYNLDLLRILCCFMVIVIHVSATNWYSSNTNSFSFNVYNLYDSLVRASVPLFIMISGVLFLNKAKIEIKNLYKTNILKMTLFCLTWNIIYYFFDLFILGGNFDLLEFINKLILGHYHLWFIPMIIGLYIITPLLTKITVNSNYKTFKYFLLIFMFGCLMKTIDYCTFLPRYDIIHNFISQLPIDIICQYYSYFLLGYFLYNYDIGFIKDKKKLLYIAFLGCVIACTCGTWYLSYKNGINTSSFYESFSIFTLVEAISIFLIFKYSKFISEEIYSKKVMDISKSTLGIYAIHVLIMDLLFHYQIITVKSFNPILSVPIISIIVFIFSLLIISLVKKIKFINKFLV